MYALSIFYVLIIEFQQKKKTFTKRKAVSFGNFFGLFYKYWDYTSKRGTQYSALEVLLLTNVSYMDLRSKWEKQKRDIEELNYICLALENNCEDFDPTFFTDYRSAYLDHILFRKKWMSFYYLKHLRGEIIFLNNILRK